jgi:hypothetical protein
MNNPKISQGIKTGIDVKYQWVKNLGTKKNFQNFSYEKILEHNKGMI